MQQSKNNGSTGLVELTSTAGAAVEKGQSAALLPLSADYSTLGTDCTISISNVITDYNRNMCVFR